MEKGEGTQGAFVRVVTQRTLFIIGRLKDTRSLAVASLEKRQQKEIKSTDLDITWHTILIGQ